MEEDEEADTVVVEIAPGTRIKMVRAGIARRLTEDEPEEYEDVRRGRARRQRGGSDPLVTTPPDPPVGAARRGDEPQPDPALALDQPFEAAPTAPSPDGPDAAAVSLDDVRENEELSLYITSADRVMDAMGFTEHGFRHANLVGRIAYQVLHRLGFSEREAVLASVAGYLHDVGNSLARDVHGQTGAVMVYQVLRDSVPGHDLMPIVAAIANHEETEGTAVSPISAAVILADKSDVHRSRVRRSGAVDKDIHDRVNYAVEQSFLRVDSDARTVAPRARDRHADQSGHGVLRDLPGQDADVPHRG